MTESKFAPDIPRRFGACHQVSADFPGTWDQQRALRDAIHPQAFGSKFHQASKRFAAHYKARWVGRSYVSWEFKPYPADAQQIAVAGMVSVSVNEQMHPSAMLFTARHELGHIWDNNDLITEADRDIFRDLVGRSGRTTWNQSYIETWAEHCREWMDSDGATWPELSALLLPEEG